MAPQAVLLDFDGVIADCENYHVVAWQRTLVRMGWELSDAAAAQAVSMDDLDFAKEVFARRGLEDADLDGWVRAKQDLTVRLIQLHPRIYPGAVELIREVADRAKVVVVTSTWRENVDALLDAVGLTEYVGLIVAKEDGAAPKPAPDGYELALKRLEIPAARAIAVEGSPQGLAAAEAAGLPAMAVGHRREPGDWTGSARFVPSLESLPELLAQLGFPDRKHS